jgi:PTH1 family peptidyl-tRNA hydrolase
VRLVLGLGNPGARYAATRHNVAWRVLDRLAARWTATPGEPHPTYATWIARPGGRPVTLLAPLTWMNASGGALGEWRQTHGDPGDLLVLSDDVYLPLGSLRLRPGGSSGGHRGLDSIETELGHREYARLRIGVGAAADSAALREHVLETFAPEEWPAVDEVVRLAADAVECWVTDGILAAMNRFNRKVRKEVSEP